MKELVETLAAWRAGGVAIGRAVVVRSFGSSPRPEGAVMLATSDGRIAGSISGGCVEGAAVEEIQRAWSTGRPRVVRYGITDEQAWDVGLACGGVIDVLIEPSVSATVEAAAQGTAVAGHNGGRAVITALPSDSPASEGKAQQLDDGRGAPGLVVCQDGDLDGTLGDPSSDAELVGLALESLSSGTSRTAEVAGRSLFIEVFPVPPRLVIVGATQIAVPLVVIARAVGFETVVIDARPAFAARERFPDVGQIVVAWPDEAADTINLGPTDAVVVLSHDAKFDEPAIVAAFARGCRYVGAIGSRSRLAARRERLVAAGVRREDLDRLRSPIGLDLGGRGPAEIALAILSEIVSMRYGRAGLALADTAGAQAGSGFPTVAPAVNSGR
jgi:xanthine dehydrogenase accessory factor